LNDVACWYLADIAVLAYIGFASEADVRRLLLACFGGLM